MDKLDIRPGQRWEAEIELAVDACSRMVVILSPHAIASKNVLAEAALAIDEGKEVIPVLYCECKIPFRLRPFQYADFRAEYAAGFEDLLASIGTQNQLTISEASPQVPPVIVSAQEKQAHDVQGRGESGDASAIV